MLCWNLDLPRRSFSLKSGPWLNTHCIVLRLIIRLACIRDNSVCTIKHNKNDLSDDAERIATLMWRSERVAIRKQKTIYLSFWNKISFVSSTGSSSMAFIGLDQPSLHNDDLGSNPEDGFTDDHLPGVRDLTVTPFSWPVHSWIHVRRVPEYIVQLVISTPRDVRAPSQTV